MSVSALSPTSPFQTQYAVSQSEGPEVVTLHTSAVVEKPPEQKSPPSPRRVEIMQTPAQKEAIIKASYKAMYEGFQAELKGENPDKHRIAQACLALAQINDNPLAGNFFHAAAILAKKLNDPELTGGMVYGLKAMIDAGKAPIDKVIFLVSDTVKLLKDTEMRKILAGLCLKEAKKESPHKWVFFRLAVRAAQGVKDAAIQKSILEGLKSFPPDMPSLPLLYEDALKEISFDALSSRDLDSFVVWFDGYKSHECMKKIHQTFMSAVQLSCMREEAESKKSPDAPPAKSFKTGQAYVADCLKAVIPSISKPEAVMTFVEGAKSISDQTEYVKLVEAIFDANTDEQGALIKLCAQQPCLQGLVPKLSSKRRNALADSIGVTVADVSDAIGQIIEGLKLAAKKAVENQNPDEIEQNRRIADDVEEYLNKQRAEIIITKHDCATLTNKQEKGCINPP